MSFNKQEEAELRELLQWWRRWKKDPLAHIVSRPVFKGPRKNTGVVISEALLERAMRKAKRDRARTRGSMSGLVELLLWQYIGQPSDVLDLDAIEDIQKPD